MNKHEYNSRRKILIGLGSGIVGATQLPNSWTKPVVNAVMLPTHAMTSEATGPVTPPPAPAPPLPTAFSGSISFAVGNVDSNSPANKLLSIFVADAHAGLQVGAVRGEMCITVDSPGGSSYTTSVLIRDSDNNNASLYEGSGTVMGGPTMLGVAGGCLALFVTPTLEVTSVTAAGAGYTVTAGGRVAAGTLAVGSGCPDASACQGGNDNLDR